MNLYLTLPPEMNRQPIELKRSVLLVGRHPECDVRLRPGSVSRRHCCLAQVNEILMVRDLGSRHGVWVNGLRVEERVLVVGDQVLIGSVILTVEAADAEVDETPVPPGFVEPGKRNEGSVPSVMESGEIALQKSTDASFEDASIESDRTEASSDRLVAGPGIGQELSPESDSGMVSGFELKL